ncbi:hypothetical protein PIB30_065325 [Stylosanthes scabra]|uniref:Uncharacterized protein n=1 Tax=Stylosanthes scabra TaxID=79078 RepID=A0ABU6QN35_9FABA|nr:hypothetical protein [Stylosanthes scabra]
MEVVAFAFCSPCLCPTLLNHLGSCSSLVVAPFSVCAPSPTKILKTGLESDRKRSLFSVQLRHKSRKRLRTGRKPGDWTEPEAAKKLQQRRRGEAAARCTIPPFSLVHSLSLHKILRLKS